MPKRATQATSSESLPVDEPDPEQHGDLVAQTESGGPREGCVSVGVQTQITPVQLPVALLAAFPEGPVYVVWKIRGAHLPCAGIHCGREAWQRIRELIPGGCYRSGADRLRRVPDIRDEEQSDRRTRAEELYQTECAKHGAPAECVVFLWQ